MAGGPAHHRHAAPGAFYQGLSEALVTYAQAQLHLTETLPDGHTRRDQYRALERQGKRVPQLHPRPLPAACAGVWAVFCELDAERMPGPAGPCPITSRQLLDWQTLHAVELTGWELEALRRLDHLRLKHDADQAAKTPTTHHPTEH